MTSSAVALTIAFKTPGAPYTQEWVFSKEEADRLTAEFKISHHPNAAKSGVYQTTNGAPLALRFADVLYIG